MRRGGFGKFCTVVALAALAAFGLSACSTTLGQQVQQKLAADVGPETVKALQDVKAALQPILATVAGDAKATRTWSDRVLGPSGTNPDPVKYALAYACPTATDAVAGLINGTIDGMIAQIGLITAPPDSDLSGGLLMLSLTQLKYGTQPDPKAQLASLRAAFDLQMDALFTGCQHLFPKKQVSDINRLLIKGGLTGLSGGALGPLLGVLP